MAVDVAAQRALNRLARQQQGAIHGEQLLDLGLSRAAVRARVARGRLVPVFWQVYVAGDPDLMPLSRASAALLSIGATATLSHRCAAMLWGLSEGRPDPIDVTVIEHQPRPRPGVRIHRIKRLHPADIAQREGLRVTSVARTLIDFATQATSSELADAFGDARARRLLTERALRVALTRAPKSHGGAAIVRRLLIDGGTYDRSRAERALRRLLREAGLPQPRVNERVGGATADFLWPVQRLIVEVDGYGTHGNRHAFEADRKRDQVHIAAGYVVIRVTWRQLRDEPLAVVARIAQPLALRSAA